MKHFAKLLLILLVFAVSVFAQNLDAFAEKIARGSTDEKRDALYQIRLLATPEASQFAIPALKDLDEIVRATATHSVVFLPPNEAAQILLPLLKDKFPFVRKEAALALGKIRNPEAAKPLIDTLQKDKDIEVRMASAQSLGEIGDISAVYSLIKILQKKPKESEDFLRRAAARSIGQIAQVQQVSLHYVITPESLLAENYDVFVNLKYSNLTQTNPGFREAGRILQNVLQNKNESADTKREAAFALGAIGDASANLILQANLNATDPYFAEICKESLLKIASVK